MSALGIDLGTSTTLIARGYQGSALNTVDAEVLSISQLDRQGVPISNTILPSLAYFPVDGSEPILGYATQGRIQEDSSRLVRAVKLLMGRQVLIPKISRTPSEVSALYLEHVLRAAQALNLLSSDTKLTVTVPASFTTNQRRDTIEALELALQNIGLAVRRGQYTLISEPVAALLAYLAADLQRREDMRTLDIRRNPLILVYDLGGGTLDLTLVRVGLRNPGEPASITNIDFNVVELTRYNQFGGEDFDQAVGRHLRDRLLEVHPELSDIALEPGERRKVRLILTDLAERLKRELNDEIHFDGDEAQLFFRTNDELAIQGKLYNFDWQVTRADYERMTQTLLEERDSTKNLIHPIRMLLHRSSSIKDLRDIDYFLAVGGMMRFVPVVDALKHCWGQDDTFLVALPQDRAVAQGAAVHSYLRMTVPDFRIQEPAADAYYVRHDKGFDQVLGRSRNGSESKGKEYRLDTTTDTLQLHIFAGDEPIADGQFESVYPSLVYQGRVRIPLGDTYPKGTPVMVKLYYPETDEEKLPRVEVSVDGEVKYDGEYQQVHEEQS